MFVCGVFLAPVSVLVMQFAPVEPVTLFCIVICVQLMCFMIPFLITNREMKRDAQKWEQRERENRYDGD